MSSYRPLATIPPAGRVSGDARAKKERKYARPSEDPVKNSGDERRRSGCRLTDRAASEDIELGRGRSGVVYRTCDGAGRYMARKVFTAAGVAKAVQYVFLGAPNPYIWSEPAIRTAVLRRRILAELVEFWFASKLRVARAYDYRWNEKHHAFEMYCELIDGDHVSLHHPYTTPGDGELNDVTRNVMKPLQAHLREAGFDGLVWQAGRGNPVALNNFMREGPDGCGGYQWAWIDLESGVPALIPINPLDLLLFYLPKSLKYRRALFDDVDVDKLRAYLRARRVELEQRLGNERIRRLEANVDALAHAQQEWKSLARHRRSIAYRCARGSISDAQARWYARRPLRWYCAEAARGFRSMLLTFTARATQLIAAVAGIKVRRFAKAFWAALCSQQYRALLARSLVAARIARWQRRGQLAQPHADALRDRLQDEEASSYLTDFGVQLAVKPLVKTLQWWVMPALWLAGVIDEVFLGVFLVAAGACVRTLYTLGRLAQNAVAGREKPWVALLVGACPVIGNLAYAVQIIVTGTKRQATVARFILYDTFSRFGQWLPVWGGSDTLTEHVLNRCPDIVFHLHRPESRRSTQPPCLSDGADLKMPCPACPGT